MPPGDVVARARGDPKGTPYPNVSTARATRP